MTVTDGKFFARNPGTGPVASITMRCSVDANSMLGLRDRLGGSLVPIMSCYNGSPRLVSGSGDGSSVEYHSYTPSSRVRRSNESLPPQVGQMCERLSHRKIPLELQAGPWQLELPRSLGRCRGGCGSWRGCASSLPLFVARYRIDSASCRRRTRGRVPASPASGRARRRACRDAR